MVSTTGGLVDTVKDGITGIHMGAMDPDDVVSTPRLLFLPPLG